MLEIESYKENNWPPCIVTVLDIAGIKSNAFTGKGSEIMLRVHGYAVDKINHGLPLHRNGYVWNDSILLLTYNTETALIRRTVLEELDDFKSSLELACGVSTYAISVMGRAFPEVEGVGASLDSPALGQHRAIVIKASSWAMANCFLIEKQLGRHRADWYIDSRVLSGIKLSIQKVSNRINLLPKNKKRTIHMYKGRLFGQLGY